MPTPRKLTCPDHELLLLLESGKTRAAIARKFGVTPECVSWRLKQLRENLPAPAARRAEETVHHTLDAVAALTDNHAVLVKLKEACERILVSPDDPDAYDVGPHDYDLEVVTIGSGGTPVRKKLRDILGSEDNLLVSVEGKFADPRKLLLEVVSQIRQHVETAVRLVERIHDVQAVQEFQHEVLAAIEAADELTAARIKDSLYQRRKLRLSLAPPGTDH